MKIFQLEQASNMMFREFPEGIDESTEMTKKEFSSYYPKYLIGVNYADRVEHLESRDIEVNRENLLDVSL